MVTGILTPRFVCEIHFVLYAQALDTGPAIGLRTASMLPVTSVRCVETPGDDQWTMTVHPQCRIASSSCIVTYCQ